jgi:RND family efflux transporter MFP subunit
LGYTVVRSPIDGQVSDRRVDPGNIVIADQTVLTSVVSTNPIHFEFSVDPAVAGTIPRPRAGAKGVQVVARVEGEEGFPHKGHVDFLDNQVDPRTGVVRGRAVFDNATGRFASGQFGRIRIARGTIDDALTVPETAIASDQSRKYVLVVGENNVAESRPVELGPSAGERRVVTGLDPNAKVIVNGGGKIYPGMPVAPQAENANAPAPSGAPANGG